MDAWVVEKLPHTLGGYRNVEQRDGEDVIAADVVRTVRVWVEPLEPRSREAALGIEVPLDPSRRLGVAQDALHGSGDDRQIPRVRWLRGPRLLQGLHAQFAESVPPKLTAQRSSGGLLLSQVFL